MQDPGFVFVDAYFGPEQTSVKTAGGTLHQKHIGLRRQDEMDKAPAPGNPFESTEQASGG